MTEEKWDWKNASKRYDNLIHNHNQMGEELKQLRRENTMLQQKVEKYERVLLGIKQSTKNIRKTKPKPVKEKKKEASPELSKALNSILPEGDEPAKE